MFHVYVLECADGSFYVGHTNDLTIRVRAHEAGTAAAYTSERRPVRLAYSETHDSRNAAVRRERQLKGWTHAKKLALIEGDAERLRELSKRRTTGD